MEGHSICTSNWSRTKSRSPWSRTRSAMASGSTSSHQPRTTTPLFINKSLAESKPTSHTLTTSSKEETMRALIESALVQATASTRTLPLLRRRESRTRSAPSFKGKTTPRSHLKSAWPLRECSRKTSSVKPRRLAQQVRTRADTRRMSSQLRACRKLIRSLVTCTELAMLL